jgi:hypothetical protein
MGKRLFLAKLFFTHFFSFFFARQHLAKQKENQIIVLIYICDVLVSIGINIKMNGINATIIKLIKIEYKQNITNLSIVLFLLKLENINGIISDIGK